MNTLIIDTSHKLLVVGIAQHNNLMVTRQQLMAKQQSESLIPFVEAVLNKMNLKINEIDEIVVTSGPGSYTGLRIAMTFVKVLALTQPLKVYTINTLLSVSGTEEVFVLLDARSKRVFAGFANAGVLTDDRIYTLDELEDIKGVKLGDLSLMGLEDEYGNVAENILSLRDKWEPVTDVDTLVPTYTT